MSSPRKPQSGAAAPRTPGEASSFRHQSEVSATVKPLQLRGGQSPSSPASSASHTPRQQVGPFTPDQPSRGHVTSRRLSADPDDSPMPNLRSPATTGRLPGRRLSGGSIASAASTSATSSIPMLYNPSIRSSSHPHPIRLRVPKSEEREELSPESDVLPGGATAKSPPSPANAWSGRLRVPSGSARSPASPDTATPKRSVEGSTPPPHLGGLPDLPAPGASLIKEALAARGLSPPLATATAMTGSAAEPSDSVELSRLTANTHTQDEEPVEDRGSPRRDKTPSQGQDTVSRGDASVERLASPDSFDVSATSAAVTPLPAAKPQDVSTSPVSVDDVDPFSEEAAAHTAVEEAHEDRAPASQHAPPSATPGEVSAAPGKPPLPTRADATVTTLMRDARTSRSRSGSSSLLVSPSRSPEQLTRDARDGGDAPATTAAVAVSPQPESDRVSCGSEDLAHPAPAPVDPVVLSVGSDDESGAVAAPPSAAGECQGSHPRGRPAAHASTDSDDSSSSPRLGTATARVPPRDVTVPMPVTVARALPVSRSASCSSHDTRSSRSRSVEAPLDATTTQGEEHDEAKDTSRLPSAVEPAVDLRSFPSQDSLADSSASDRQAPLGELRQDDMSVCPITTAELQTPVDATNTSAVPPGGRGELSTPPLSQPSLLDTSLNMTRASAAPAMADTAAAVVDGPSTGSSEAHEVSAWAQPSVPPPPPPATRPLRGTVVVAAMSECTATSTLNDGDTDDGVHEDDAGDLEDEAVVLAPRELTVSETVSSRASPARGTPIDGDDDDIESIPEYEPEPYLQKTSLPRKQEEGEEERLSTSASSSHRVSQCPAVSAAQSPEPERVAAAAAVARSPFGDEDASRRASSAKDKSEEEEEEKPQVLDNRFLHDPTAEDNSSSSASDHSIAKSDERVLDKLNEPLLVCEDSQAEGRAVPDTSSREGSAVAPVGTDSHRADSDGSHGRSSSSHPDSIADNVAETRSAERVGASSEHAAAPLVSPCAHDSASPETSLSDAEVVDTSRDTSAQASPRDEHAQAQASEPRGTSTSSSGSVFVSHDVQRPGKPISPAAPLLELAQTTAVVELPDIKDEEVDEGDSDDTSASSGSHSHPHREAEDAHRESAASEAAQSSSDEASRSRTGSGGVNNADGDGDEDAQPVVPGGCGLESARVVADATSDMSSEDSVDDFVMQSAPAHPFSAAGRRAQLEVSAVSSRGGVGSVTASRLPPDSVLFHTAISAGSSEDEEPAHEPPQRTPQDISMHERRQNILRGYLDDVESMEADQRALLVRDCLEGWRTCAVEEAIARGALPHHVASSKLVMSSTSTSSSSHSRREDNSGHRDRANNAQSDTGACAAADGRARALSVRRFSHMSSSTSSSATSLLNEVSAAMDGTRREAAKLAALVSDVLADEQLFRLYVQDREAEARSALSRLARCATLALDRTSLLAQEAAEREKLEAMARHDARRYPPQPSSPSTSNGSELRQPPVTATVCPDDVNFTAYQAVLVAKEPLEREDIGTAEVNERLQMQQMWRRGLAVWLRDRHEEGVPLSDASSPALEDPIEEEESAARDGLRTLEKRDRVLLAEYHSSRLSGSSPSSAVGAAARLLASLSVDGTADDLPEFFEWNPTTNTSEQKSSADATQQQQQHSSSSVASASGRTRQKNPARPHGAAAATTNTTTSSPSPCVHSSLLLTSSDPSHEEHAHAVPPQAATSRHSSCGTNSSARRSPTVIPNAQTEAAALLRSVQNAYQAAAHGRARGVRRSQPHRVLATKGACREEADTATAVPSSAEEAVPRGSHRRSRSASAHGAHTTHADHERTWRSSLRSLSGPASRSASVTSQPRGGGSEAGVVSAADGLPRRRRPTPRALQPPPPLLSRHAVPCSYCSGGGTARGGDCNARYHQLLRNYGQEAEDGSPRRTTSSSSRTPRSPSARPYADDIIFDSPSRHNATGIEAGEGCEEEEVYYTAQPTPPRAWSMVAQHGSPNLKDPRALPDTPSLSALLFADEDDAKDSNKSANNSLSAGDDHGPGHADPNLDRVFRVLYPPERTFVNDDTMSVDAHACPHPPPSPPHGLATCDFVEVVRQGPHASPPLPPVSRRGKSRSTTRRPASAEHTPLAVDEPELPHHMTPTTLSVTRAQDEQLLQAIYRARRGGSHRGAEAVSQGGSVSNTAAGSRVRRSKPWSPNKCGGATTSGGPVLITRLPLEAGPGVWSLDGMGRALSGTEPYKPTSTRYRSPQARASAAATTVCVATVDAAVRRGRAGSANAPNARATTPSGVSPSRRTPSGTRLHGSVIASELPVTAGEASAAHTASGTRADVDEMVCAFREWARKGGVGVVHLPSTLAREFPVPMRAQLPRAPPQQQSPTPVAATETVRAPRTSRRSELSSVPARTRTPKYSYVDRFFKQSPEQVAQTVESVQRSPSPPLRRCRGVASPCVDEVPAVSWTDGEAAAPEAPAFVHTYWEQRRERQVARALSRLPSPAARVAPVRAERDKPDSSLHFYVGRHSTAHLYV